jgi:FMN reductase [NAD(P)H]
MAEARGLGSVYIGTILSVTQSVREILETPQHVLPVMLLSLGYPKAVPSGIPKLPRHTMVHDERYQVPTEEEVLGWYEAKYGEIKGNIDKYLETRYVEAVEADRQDGVGWVKRVKEEMRRLEIRSNAEFLFKVRYPTDQMVELNGEMEQAFRDAGFDCFRGSHA